MKGTSKFIMGATLVMVVTLAIVLGLILVLLAELYCSLLLRRRQLRKTNTIPMSTTTINSASSSHTPLSNVYSQGVLQAPRRFLFPCKNDLAEANASPHGIGLVSLSFSSSPLASFLARAPPRAVQQDTLACAEGDDDHLVYISNPIYDNEEAKACGANTPFQTPHTSPSRLQTSASSVNNDDDDDTHDDDDDAHSSPSLTPPLTPMNKLPSSVSLRDATSFAASATDSHSINGPSSSSDTPSTSPSWRDHTITLLTIANSTENIYLRVLTEVEVAAIPRISSRQALDFAHFIYMFLGLGDCALFEEPGVMVPMQRALKAKNKQIMSLQLQAKSFCVSPESTSIRTTLVLRKHEIEKDISFHQANPRIKIN
ncbi:hypothetical protein CR513_60036, partial [Mucuna pruriens]